MANENFWKVSGAPELPRYADLNKYREPGTWICSSYKVGDTIKNLPKQEGANNNHAFTLINTQVGQMDDGANTITQILIVLYGGIYTRCFKGWNKRWTSWLFMSEGKAEDNSPKVISSSNDVDLDTTPAGVYHKLKGVKLPNINEELYSPIKEIGILRSVEKFPAKIVVDEIDGTKFWTVSFNYKMDSRSDVYSYPLTIRSSFNINEPSYRHRWFIDDSLLPNKQKLEVKPYHAEYGYGIFHNIHLFDKDNNEVYLLEKGVPYNIKIEFSEDFPTKVYPKVLRCIDASSKQIISDVALNWSLENPNSPVGTFISNKDLDSPLDIQLSGFVEGDEVATFNTKLLSSKKSTLKITFSDAIKSRVADNKVVLYIKGYPDRYHYGGKLYVDQEFDITSPIIIENLSPDLIYEVKISYGNNYPLYINPSSILDESTITELSIREENVILPKKGNLSIAFEAQKDVPSNILGTLFVGVYSNEETHSSPFFHQENVSLSDTITLNDLDMGYSYSLAFMTPQGDPHLDRYAGLGDVRVLMENEMTNTTINIMKIPGEPYEPDINIGDSYIIDHNYDTEHVMWLGRIVPPKPEDMKPYIVTGKPEVDLDENGNVIEGSGTTATNEVPRYYIEETTKNTENEKADWYNVNKAMADDPADDAMCWAMSAASAVQWWFDKLDNQVDDLFAIRRSKGILDGNSATLVLDDMNGKDVHYTPLPTSTDSTDILNKSGVGQYTRKSFYNMGGDSRDLFRLYFFKENTFGKNNYKGHRALGLLDGMGYNRGPGTYSEDPNEKLWEYVPITNKSRNEIVQEFKTAFAEGCAIVLHQANIPDDELVEGITSKAHHAIIAWGIIFDEKDENIVGLYVGDNNIRESHLTRVDLVYKKLSETGGRYYYAWPFVDQHGTEYVKQTSLHAFTKLYPPSDRIKNWITTESSKLPR